jgi:molybdopterin converting factor subunit 1
VPAELGTARLAPHLPAGYNSLVPVTSQTVRVKVLFFGRLKEIAGRSEDSAEIADGASIEQLFGSFTDQHPGLTQFRTSLVASRNQEFAAWSTPLHAGDEVAFLPPVSGG